MGDINKGQYRDVFVWKTIHEKCVIAELLVVELYNFKPGSKEKGLAWKQIADNLNSVSDPKFRVTHRSVCDKFNNLKKMKLLKTLKKMKESKRGLLAFKGLTLTKCIVGLWTLVRGWRRQN